MALCSSELEVQDTPAWMIASHRDTGDVHGPRVSSRPSSPDRHSPPYCSLARNFRHHPHVFRGSRSTTASFMMLHGAQSPDDVVRQEPDDSLQGDLLHACRALAVGQPPPRHLYCHIAAT